MSYFTKEEDYRIPNIVIGDFQIVNYMNKILTDRLMETAAFILNTHVQKLHQLMVINYPQQLH